MAMMLSPPGRFSTTTGWPQRCDSFSANSRAPTSTAAPGPNGTMNLTDRVGQAGAWATAPDTARPASSALTKAKTRNRVMAVLTSKCRVQMDTAKLRAPVTPTIGGHSIARPSRVLQRGAGLASQRAQHGFGGERQFHQPHADRIVDGVRDRRRHAQRRGFSRSFGAERSVLLIGVDRLVHHHFRHVEETRNLVIRERGIRDLAGVEMHLFEHRETELHERRAGNLRFDDPRIDGRAAVDDVDQLEDAYVPS